MKKLELWQSFINEWKASGQTKQAFLKQKNINQSTFLIGSRKRPLRILMTTKEVVHLFRYLDLSN